MQNQQAELRDQDIENYKIERNTNCLAMQKQHAELKDQMSDKYKAMIRSKNVIPQDAQIV